MGLSRIFGVLAVLVMAAATVACSSGGGGTQFEYAPPTGFNPSAGLSPDLTNPNALGGPAYPPFNPW